MLFAGPDFLPYWQEGQTAEDYHADRSAVNSGSLKKLHDSPRSFERYFIGREPDADTQSKSFGRMFHTASLEGEQFFHRYAVMPEHEWLDENGELNRRKKIYQDKKKDWLAQNHGREFVTQDQLDDIHGMVESVLAHPDASLILKGAVTELSGYYRDPQTNIRCKIRVDALNLDISVLADVKTAASCRAEDFSKDLYEYQYPLSKAMYLAGIREIMGYAPEDQALIVVEKKKPYECAVYEIEKRTLAWGQARYRQALDQLKVFLEKNEFPAYQTQAKQIGLPPWALIKEGLI